MILNIAFYFYQKIIETMATAAIHTMIIDMIIASSLTLFPPTPPSGTACRLAG